MTQMECGPGPLFHGTHSGTNYIYPINQCAPGCQCSSALRTKSYINTVEIKM